MKLSGRWKPKGLLSAGPEWEILSPTCLSNLWSRRLAKLLIEEKDALADIFELRKLIEPHIAALAAERATEGDIERMKQYPGKAERSGQSR